MSEFVWWVRKMQFTAGSNEKHNAFTVSGYGKEEVDDDERRIVSSQAIYGGGPVPDHLLPYRFTGYYKVAKTKRLGPDGNRLQAFFVTQHKPIVTEQAISVLSRFDLGAAKLHPVRFFENDGQEIDQRAHLLLVTNIKNTFSFEHSQKVIDRMPMPGTKKRPRATYDMPDDDVALVQEACVGPDIWIEENFRNTFFLSDGLARALRGAGIAELFDLVRARVV